MSKATHDGTIPPDWAIVPRKGLLQSAWDLVGAPLRMIMLPDSQSERLRLTSLRAERYAAVLPTLRGCILDVGAGDNALIRLYRKMQRNSEDAAASVGVDVVDWGGDTLKVASSENLPFEDGSFDTVCFIACLNHIPERAGALKEAHRVLKPGGTVVATMIGRLIGGIGHAIWWYSEDKHRDIAEGEVMGIDSGNMLDLFHQAGFENVSVKRFVYGMNYLFVATRE